MVLIIIMLPTHITMIIYPNTISRYFTHEADPNSVSWNITRVFQEGHLRFVTWKTTRVLYPGRAPVSYTLGIHRCPLLWLYTNFLFHGISPGYITKGVHPSNDIIAKKADLPQSASHPSDGHVIGRLDLVHVRQAANGTHLLSVKRSKV